jgi:AraC family transcriptional regulator of adaptative response / DNA-3-methyladenine glycosylase II
VEEVRDGCYRRSINLPNGVGILSLGPLVPSPAWRSPGKYGAGQHGASQHGASQHGASQHGDPGYVECELQLEDLRDLTAAVQRCRRLLDLDADPETVTGYLAADPVLGPLARANPGRRSPGHVDGSEVALRAVLGQQVSVAAARRLGARLTAAYGKPLSRPDGPLTHCFPAAETLAAADPDTLPMPRSRALALTGLAAALAGGEVSLDPGADRDRAAAALLALPGIGPWTVSYIRMRALSDPDAFLPSDIGVLGALTRLGAVPGGTGPAVRGRAARAAAALAQRLAESWRPWRSYAVHHLWAYLEEEKDPS